MNTITNPQRIRTEAELIEALDVAETRASDQLVVLIRDEQGVVSEVAYEVASVRFDIVTAEEDEDLDDAAPYSRTVVTIVEA